MVRIRFYFRLFVIAIIKTNYKLQDAIKINWVKNYNLSLYLNDVNSYLS